MNHTALSRLKVAAPAVPLIARPGLPVPFTIHIFQCPSKQVSPFPSGSRSDSTACMYKFSLHPPPPTKEKLHEGRTTTASHSINTVGMYRQRTRGKGGLYSLPCLTESRYNLFSGLPDLRPPVVLHGYQRGCQISMRVLGLKLQRTPRCLTHWAGTPSTQSPAILSTSTYPAPRCQAQCGLLVS